MSEIDKMAEEFAADRVPFGDYGHGDVVAAIRAALLTAPPGWKLVPVEPTDEMLAAGERGHWQKTSDMLSPTPTEFPGECGGPMGYAYIDMLAAAPEPK